MQLWLIVSLTSSALLSDILSFVTPLTAIKKSTSCRLQPFLTVRSDTTGLSSVVINQTVIAIRFLAVFIFSTNS